jgi:hypothetical protein
MEDNYKVTRIVESSFRFVVYILPSFTIKTAIPMIPILAITIIRNESGLGLVGASLSDANHKAIFLQSSHSDPFSSR